MTSEGAAGGAARAKAKVFLSYARKDIAFVDRLDAALTERGIDTLIDRTDIYAFEEWWPRIQALIARADTIVFVLSPDAVRTESVCQKEVAYAQSLNKRFAPVVCRRVDDGAVPEELRRLNWVFFEDGAQFEASVDKLADALGTDIHWIRQHTELGEDARRWAAAGRPRGLLLDSITLADAERWIAARPGNAPAPTEETRDFIAESRRAAVRRRNLLTGSLAAGLVIALSLAALAYWQRGIAEEQRALAQRNEAIAIEERDRALLTQSRFLADLAQQRIRDGDGGTAMLLALEALPDPDGGVPRPYAAEAEAALYNGSLRLQEIGIVARHDQPFISAALSPDGRRLATSASDYVVRLWDMETREQIATAPQSGKGLIHAIAFSPDGRRLALAVGDNTARLLSSETLAEVGVLRGHEKEVRGAHFSPDGHRLVTSSLDNTARIWDVETQKEVAVLRGHENSVFTAAFSPDGRLVLTASLDKTSRLWDAESYVQLAVLGHDDVVLSAAFSPDGAKAVSVSGDRTAKLWDVASRSEIGTLRGHTDSVWTCAFSADGRLVVTGSSDETARVWEVESQRQLAILVSGEAQVRSAFFTPDSRSVLTASYGYTVRLWELEAPTFAVFSSRKAGGLSRASFSPDGKRMIMTAGKKTLLFDVHRSTEISSTNQLPTGGDEPVMLIADWRLGVWHIESLSEAMVIEERSGWVTAAVFSPDGRFFATASQDGTARLWDADTRREIHSFEGHQKWVSSVDFSPDGRRLLTASWDDTARLWDIETRTQVGMLKGDGFSVRTAAFSPDGTRIATTGSFVDLVVWDARTFQQIATFKGHQGDIATAVFSPNGRMLLTASSDKTARLWDIAGQREIARLSHDDRVSLAAFSRDGKEVLTLAGEMTMSWPAYATTKELIAYGKTTVPRCLTRWQREAAFLLLEPPSWCIDMGKWPYDSDDWKTWLQYKSADANPPLPDTPQWKSWLSVRQN
jgi:WD40 repeat protein